MTSLIHRSIPPFVSTTNSWADSSGSQYRSVPSIDQLDKPELYVSRAAVRNGCNATGRSQTLGVAPCLVSRSASVNGPRIPPPGRLSSHNSRSVATYAVFALANRGWPLRTK